MLDHVASFRTDADRFATLAGRDLTVDVPSCPGWTLADLVVHLGRVHLYAKGCLADGTQRAPFGAPPEEGADLAAWYRDAAHQLSVALEAIGPDDRAWNFVAGEPAPAGFWARRQAQETLVHRVDAELALGDVTPMDTAISLDGLDEILTQFLPRLKPVGAGESFHFHATDGDGEWLVTLGPEGPTVEVGHAKGDVAVRGAAGDLLLWAWGRPPIGDVEIIGDAAVGARWSELVNI